MLSAPLRLWRRRMRRAQVPDQLVGGGCGCVGDGGGGGGGGDTQVVQRGRIDGHGGGGGGGASLMKVARRREDRLHPFTLLLLESQAMRYQEVALAAAAIGGWRRRRVRRGGARCRPGSTVRAVRWRILTVAVVCFQARECTRSAGVFESRQQRRRRERGQGAAAAARAAAAATAAAIEVGMAHTAVRNRCSPCRTSKSCIQIRGRHRCRGYQTNRTRCRRRCTYHRTSKPVGKVKAETSAATVAVGASPAVRSSPPREHNPSSAMAHFDSCCRPNHLSKQCV